MQRQKQIAELHRVVGPFVAFLVTQTDGPAFTQALSIVLRLFLNVYFSLLIKNQSITSLLFWFCKKTHYQGMLHGRLNIVPGVRKPET